MKVKRLEYVGEGAVCMFGRWKGCACVHIICNLNRMDLMKNGILL